MTDPVASAIVCINCEARIQPGHMRWVGEQVGPFCPACFAEVVSATTGRDRAALREIARGRPAFHGLTAEMYAANYLREVGDAEN